MPTPNPCRVDGCKHEAEPGRARCADHHRVHSRLRVKGPHRSPQGLVARAIEAVEETLESDRSGPRERLIAAVAVPDLLRMDRELHADSAETGE